MNNVDRIFSEKLGGYSSAPPAEAWEKVASGLQAPTAANRWLPIAIGRAAVLLPFVVAASWLLTRPEPVQQPVAANKIIGTPAPVPAAIIPKENTRVQHVATRRKAVSNPVVITPVLQPAPDVIAATPETVAVEEITIEPVELIAEVPEPAPAVAKPMVIVITLDPVVQAPQADKKALERVAEFALTVKHSDPLGSLRGAKDELFAFDLHKKSTKKN